MNAFGLSLHVIQFNGMMKQQSIFARENLLIYTFNTSNSVCFKLTVCILCFDVKGGNGHRNAHPKQK